MRVKTFPLQLCKNQNKPDAACRKLPRCRACNRVLAFAWQDRLCDACRDAKLKGGAA